MSFTWEKDGLLFGQLTEDDCGKGGKWMVGDLLPAEHPGHSTAVMYKSWVARPDKYAPGNYPFKDRKETGVWEYVIVLQGVLTLQTKRSEKTQAKRENLPAHKGKLILPACLRSWELTDQSEARGLTLLGNGEYQWDKFLGAFLSLGEFQLHNWTNSTATPHLHSPVFRTAGLPYQYVEVFTGQLSCITEQGQVTMLPGDHVYVKAGTKASFQPNLPETSGTVLYYSRER